MDLVVLAADKDTEASVRGVLCRTHSLNIRPVHFAIYVHPEHDPGCRLRAHQFLRAFTRSYDHALVIFDREGCGKDSACRTALEDEVEQALGGSGWGDRAAAVVADPELEAWVWSDSPAVDSVLGWAGHQPALRQWLHQRGQLPAGETKPARPKECMRDALREVRRPPSSSLFEQLAQKASLGRCTDPAFAKLRAMLQAWFPA